MIMQADCCGFRFIQQNCIKEMSGLEELTNLGAINLSENFVKKVDHLKGLTG